eukprot:c22573_g1_i2 orf=318-1517(+)
MGVFSELSYSHKKLHVHLLYCLLGIQLTYIVIDHFAYHYIDDPMLARVCNRPSSAAAMVRDKVRRVNAAAPLKRPGICKRREDYYDDDDDEEEEEERRTNHISRVNLWDDKDAKEGEQGLTRKMGTNSQDNKDEERKRRSMQKRSGNPWHQVKWIGKPATCLVKGKLIERLDEESNFRRGYALKFVEDVEDKTHLLPWLLASKVNLNSRKRRVLIDLGANRFTTSVRWFLRMYPCDFTEIHAFETNPRSWRAPKEAFKEEENQLGQSANNSLLVKEKPGIPQWMLERVHIYYKLASHEDDERRGKVNITRFIKEELKLKREDAVVVKIDIEGSEWPLLKAWLEDPDMPSIVDELFLEAHYAHPSMSAFGWDSFSPITRQDAKHMLGDLRWKGFYAHAWP